MQPGEPKAVDAYILALPETAGSALYGMVDVLAAAGTLWQELVGEGQRCQRIVPHITSLTRQPFTCGNAIPVSPELSINDIVAPKIVIVPELWLAPDDALADRHEPVKVWLQTCYREGATLYSACSGSVLLAASGLLDGREATSHWGYSDLFRKSFPEVRFNPAPSLCIGDRTGRIVTAGGTTSWHDLALHIIARHCSPGEALQIAKVYLLKWHAEGQLPFTKHVRRQAHADAVVKRAETWLSENYRQPHAVSGVVSIAGIPERSLKRRFKAATGSSLIDYVQNLRIDEAKTLLESQDVSSECVAGMVGYDNPAFFRKVFKRCTGMTPGAYRKMFAPILANATLAGPEANLSST